MATHETFVFVVLLGVAMASGCAAEDPPTGPPTPPPDTTSTGPGTPTGTGGQGGMGEGGMGGAGGAEPEPVICMGDFAYRADAMIFVDPTPAALAAAIAEHVGEEDHPLTLVLRSADAGATLGASFAIEAGPAYHFLPPLTPPFTDAMVEEGGTFHTITPATEAFARIRHDEGALDLSLVDVTVNATTELDCGLAQVTLEATIPASFRDETIVGSAGPSTIGELAGGNDGDDIPVAATFTGTSVSFDFDSLDSP